MGKIRQATYRDLISIKKMTDEYIGRDFYTMSFLEEIQDEAGKFLYVYVNEEDRAVAYMYIFISTLQEALKVLNTPYELSGLGHVKLDSKVGVFKTSCTERSYRNQGILTSFLHNLEVIFWKNNAERILLPALRSPSGVIPVENVVLDAGFQKAAEIMKPWSHIDSYCPYCRHKNCQCDSVLFTKKKE